MHLVSVHSMVVLYLNQLWGVNLPCAFSSLIYVLVLMEFDYIFHFFCAEALSILNVVIHHPQARNSNNVMAYDTAVSALGKICHFHRDKIDSSQVCLSIISSYM